jgi:hypothetical protein
MSSGTGDDEPIWYDPSVYRGVNPNDRKTRAVSEEPEKIIDRPKNLSIKKLPLLHSKVQIYNLDEELKNIDDPPQLDLLNDFFTTRDEFFTTRDLSRKFSVDGKDYWLVGFTENAFLFETSDRTNSTLQKEFYESLISIVLSALEDDPLYDVLVDRIRSRLDFDSLKNCKTKRTIDDERSKIKICQNQDRWVFCHSSGLDGIGTFWIPSAFEPPIAVFGEACGFPRSDYVETNVEFKKVKTDVTNRQKIYNTPKHQRRPTKNCQKRRWKM